MVPHVSEADQKEFLQFWDDSGDSDNDNDESAAMAVVGPQAPEPAAAEAGAASEQPSATVSHNNQQGPPHKDAALDLSESDLEALEGRSREHQTSKPQTEADIVQEMARLGITRRNLGSGLFPHEVQDAPGGKGITLGRVHSMSGKTLKATCKQHPGCHLMMQKAWLGDEASTLTSLYRWLASGRSCNENRHWAEAKRIADSARGKKQKGKS